VAYGGRGGGKSQSMVRMLLILALSGKKRILNLRAVQRSLKESVYQIYSNLISEFGLENYFTLRSNKIECVNGSELLFMGLNGKQSSNLRSLEEIDYCFIEEAEDVEEAAWQVLIPSIRAKDSEIWISFNPKRADSPVYQRFVKNDRPDCLLLYINYDQNPFLPEVLKNEALYEKEHNYERYRAIWLGEIIENREELVFYKHFTEGKLNPEPGKVLMYGLDWGFANDPTALVGCTIEDKKLYIWEELYLHKKTIEEVVAIFKAKLPLDALIYADNSRPDLATHFRAAGFCIRDAPKGKGSVAAGIYYLKGFEQIVVSENCPNTLYELNNYKYKVDKYTGQVLNQPQDNNNHTIDAMRYALSAYIGKKVSLLEVI